MESVQLLTFYRNVTSWPRTDAELSAVVDKVLQLLPASLAAISVSDRISVRFRESAGAALLPSSLQGAGRAGLEGFEDFLRRQIKLLGEGNGPLRQIQLAQDVSGGQLRQLTLASFSGEMRSDSSGTAGVGGSTFFDSGWMIVGTEKALSAKEEILLISAAQRLSELAKIARLEHSIQMRSQFLSIASHELKTPLTSIYGILQLQERMSRLKRDHGGEAAAAPADQKRSYLKILLRQVERLNELIDGLLDVSRIQNNRFVVEPSEADVAVLVRDTVQSRLSVIAQEAGVKLHLEVPDALAAWVDPVRMEEVVSNLVMNAIRFSPEGGVVTIRLVSESGALRLTVRDQGPNVPPEDRERIFQPFERAQRTSRLGGLGLGLFISRQIALLHGGNVSLVESIPGKGNMFEAYFPMRAANVISA